MNKGIGGFIISFQAMNVASMFLIFQLVACLHMKFGNVEMVGSYKFKRKNISCKGSSIENIGKFGFQKITKIAVYTASNQSVDGLKTFQAINSALIFSVFQIGAGLHVKFGKNGVGRLLV